MKHKPFIQERVNRRPVRFAERVKQELIDLIPGSLKDPRIRDVKFITISSVELSEDLKHGNVMFSLMSLQKNDKHVKEIELALNKAAGFLRKELMLRLNTKITPQLIFRYDSGFDKSAELDPFYKKISALRTDESEE